MTENMTVLQEAESLINGDRAATYGDARESFDRIAGLWSAYLGTTVTALDVTNLMVLLKVSRTKGTFHRDSYVDIGGYAGLGEKLVEPEETPTWDRLELVPHLVEVVSVEGRTTSKFRTNHGVRQIYMGPVDGWEDAVHGGAWLNDFAPFKEVV